jgi:hypothetical protein
MDSPVRITLFTHGRSGYQVVPGGSFSLDNFGSVPRVADRIIKPMEGADKAADQQSVYEVLHCYFAPRVQGGSAPGVFIIVEERPGVDGEFELFQHAPPGTPK